MKLGISVKIDVTKIDKARLFKGEKGTYLDLTTFIDTEQEGQYGDHGFISQSVTKEEREQKVQTPILGNVKVFFKDGQGNQNPAHQASQSFQEPTPNQPPIEEGFDDSIPF